jgi:hypothetical protein
MNNKTNNYNNKHRLPNNNIKIKNSFPFNKLSSSLTYNKLCKLVNNKIKKTFHNNKSLNNNNKIMIVHKKMTPLIQITNKQFKNINKLGPITKVLRIFHKIKLTMNKIRICVKKSQLYLKYILIIILL